jgi:drug/metabolite transporter (DMT)-like permease
MSRFRMLLLPVATSLLFSGSFVAAKYVTQELPPLTATLMRYIAALAFLSLLSLRKRPVSSKSGKPNLLLIVAASLLGIVGYHFCFFLSLRYTSVDNSAIINAFNPAVTAALAALFLRERLSRTNYSGIALALIGVIALVTRADVQRLTAVELNRGDLLMLCAVGCWGSYALIIKKLSASIGSLRLTLLTALFGVLILAPLSLTEKLFQHPGRLSTSTVLSILYMGICASGLGYLLYNHSIKEIGPTRTASLVLSMVPLFVAVLSFLVFDERVTLLMIVSAVMIILGLNLALRVRLSLHPQTTEPDATQNLFW